MKVGVYRDFFPFFAFLCMPDPFALAPLGLEALPFGLGLVFDLFAWPVRSQYLSFPLLSWMGLTELCNKLFFERLNLLFD